MLKEKKACSSTGLLSKGYGPDDEAVTHGAYGLVVCRPFTDNAGMRNEKECLFVQMLSNRYS
jgi:hypothetical protein